MAIMCALGTSSAMAPTRPNAWKPCAPWAASPPALHPPSPLPRPISGLRTRTPRPAAAAAALIGAAAGFCLSYQQSAGRLMGFLPNDREVEVGLASKR